MPEARPVDYLSRDGAEALADKVRRYWLSCGAQVGVRVEFGSGIWVVRSGLARGLPPPAVT